MTLDQIFVVPRNGYINRLQAWASAEVMGGQFNVPVRVVWEPAPLAPARATDLFALSAINQKFCSADEFTTIVGCTHEELPRYLYVNSKQRLVSLAGHDLGEQVFMADLAAAVKHKSAPKVLVLIAGGKFCLNGTRDFAHHRANFYKKLPWKSEIDSAVETSCASQNHFVGLHIRGTDRSREAPPPRKVRHALRRLREVGPTSLFVAADSEHEQIRWLDEARRFGFEAWSREVETRDRRLVDESFGAIVDWRVLSRSLAMVYTASSSFGHEAAINAGNPGANISLSASLARQRARSAWCWAFAAATYPARRLGYRHG